MSILKVDADKILVMKMLMLFSVTKQMIKIYSDVVVEGGCAKCADSVFVMDHEK
jgi:hypothetical protein